MAELGYRVRPRSTADIARAAEEFLRRCAPDHLTAAAPLDLMDLVDHRLEPFRITVCPVKDTDLPDAEAETRASAGGWIEIWMRIEFFDALFEENSNTVRARSTLAHEIGHATLHDREVRTGRHCPELLALRRAPRSRLKPYEDSEWQAHAFAGALLVPRPALRRIERNIALIADRFAVSEPFVRSHLCRMDRIL